MLTLCAAAAAQNIVPANALETGFSSWQGRHGAWERRNVSRVADGEQPFLRFVADKPATLDLRVPVQAGWGTLRLSVESRREGIVRGDNPWNVPNAELNFKDGAGKDLLPHTRHNWMSADSDGWEKLERDYEVPAGAATLVVTLQMWQVRGGTVDFRNLRVVPIGQRTGAEAQAVREQIDTTRRAAAIARQTPESIENLTGIGGGVPSRHGWTWPTTEPVRMAGPLMPPPVTGTTYFVSPLGDNETGDGSQARPWKTIQHGMNQLHPGDRLFVREGEYRETGLNFARNGTPDAFITVSGYPGERARILGGGSVAVFNMDAGERHGTNRPNNHLVIRDLYIDAQNANNAIRIHGLLRKSGPEGDALRAQPWTSRDVTHHIWIANNEIVGGGHAESVVQVTSGANRVVISNNRVSHSRSTAIMLHNHAHGCIVEWNTVHDVGWDADDAGAIKVMAPKGLMRYNTVYNNYRKRTSTVGGWSPGGEQWNHLQGLTGIYLDWAMVHERNNPYLEGELEDPAWYVYGNRIFNNNAGIYAWRSDHAVIFDNVIHGSGRNVLGGFVEGDPAKPWLNLGGPSGRGITVSFSEHVRVFRNLSYDNARDGLVDVARSTGNEWFGNTTFGNDRHDILMTGGRDVLMGGNRILTASGSKPSIHFHGWNYSDFGALRKDHPHNDHGSEVIEVEGDIAALLHTPTAMPQGRDGSMAHPEWGVIRDRLRAGGRLTASVRQPGEAREQAPFDPTESLQEPLPWRLPGRVEFENFDEGGQGVSYHDTTENNQGGHYRREFVDIKANPEASNGAVVGWTAAGEWLEYTVQTRAAGEFRLQLGYANGRNEVGVIQLSIGEEVVGDPISLAPTGDWDNLAVRDVGKVEFPTGTHILRVTILEGPVDLDYMEFSE